VSAEELASGSFAVGADGKLIDLSLEPQSSKVVAVTPTRSRWQLLLPALVLFLLLVAPPLAGTILRRRRGAGLD
jgi:hypothetical protein